MDMLSLNLMITEMLKRLPVKWMAKMWKVRSLSFNLLKKKDVLNEVRIEDHKLQINAITVGKQDTGQMSVGKNDSRERMATKERRNAIIVVRLGISKDIVQNSMIDQDRDHIPNQDHQVQDPEVDQKIKRKSIQRNISVNQEAEVEVKKKEIEAKAIPEQKVEKIEVEVVARANKCNYVF